jgi:hypothetical protein
MLSEINTKGQLLYDFHLYEVPGVVKFIRIKYNAGLEVEGRGNGVLI